jgi:hypothetical protein
MVLFFRQPFFSLRMVALSERSALKRSRAALAPAPWSAAKEIPRPTLASGTRTAERFSRRALASGARTAECFSRCALVAGAGSTAEQNLPKTSRSCRRACSECFQLSSGDRIEGGSGGSMLGCGGSSRLGCGGSSDVRVRQKKRQIERGWGEAEECGGSSEVDFCTGFHLYGTVV